MKPRRVVSFDANAAAPVLPQAWDAYAEATRVGASSTMLDAARAEVAKYIGAEPDEIMFTSGGTEADGWALLGALEGFGLGPTPHVVTSVIEHAAVQSTLDMAVAQKKATVTRVPVPRRGCPDPHDVIAALTDNTRIVSWVAASNETGVVQPIEAIAEACRARGILMHTDAVQAVGRLPVNVNDWGVDLLCFSGHKLGAVGGIGVLYCRRGVTLGTPFTGASELTNTPGALSLAAALRHGMTQAERDGVQKLRDHFEATMRAAHPSMEVIGGDAPRLLNTSCVRFPGVQGDGLLMALDIAGFAVSTGSACSSGSIEPSPILLGMGFTPTEALEGLRVSMHRDTQAADVDALAVNLTKALSIAKATA